MLINTSEDIQTDRQTDRVQTNNPFFKLSYEREDTSKLLERHGKARTGFADIRTVFTHRATASVV